MLPVQVSNSRRSSLGRFIEEKIVGRNSRSQRFIPLHDQL
jgi:hypothetical protein